MNRTYLPYIVIAALILIIFMLVECDGDTKGDTVTIVTEAQEGKSDTLYLPSPIIYKDRPVTVVKWKDKIVEIPNPVNVDLVDAYQKAQDSISRFKLFLEAISENEYNIPIEDSLLLTNNYIKTQGKVLAFQQTYTIKPRNIEVELPKNRFRMTAGFEVGNSTKFDNFSVKGNVNVNGLSLGYDTNNTIWLGYNWTLFK